MAAIAKPKVFTTTPANKAAPIKFVIDEDEFEAIHPERLPANVLVTYSESINEGKFYRAHQSFFSQALLPDSALLFLSRLDSVENPITLTTMTDVAEYLISTYSNRD